MSIRFALGLRTYHVLEVSTVIIWGLLCCTAAGHVNLLAPNGGEIFDGGDNVSIEWQVAISHSTMDWDLWYATESNEGPWEEIALDLAAGDTSPGALHSFDWSLPNVDITDAWVRVRQDNAGQDYYGISEASFSVAARLGGGDFTGDGNVDAADLMVWEQGFGITSSAAPSEGDANLDGDVDGTDFLDWQTAYDNNGSLLQAESVPEPAATFLLALGMILMFWARR